MESIQPFLNVIESDELLPRGTLETFSADLVIVLDRRWRDACGCRGSVGKSVSMSSSHEVEGTWI